MKKNNVEFKKSSLASLLAGILMIFIAGACHAQQAVFDVVFKQGRVIDPETKFDAIRDVGITGKKIISVSTEPLKGKVEIDAKGKILGPGFIDLHVHGVNVPTFWMQAFDGVTTALELEAGGFPIKKAYANAAKLHLPLNYGFSASWAGARLAVADGIKNLDGSLETATQYFG
jgi:N-acyl-D-glutamate deacylase